MENRPVDILRRERWRLAAWAGPALLAVAFAHQALLPMAARLAEARSRLAALRENTYETSWLDSTHASLKADADLLAAFQSSRRAALSSDSSVQAAVDRIRGLAQASGFEVIKTTPSLARADSLGLLKVRLEGFAGYDGLMRYFATLRRGHPDLYVEEMLIRQGGERSGGRLEGVLVVQTYTRDPEAFR